MVFWNLIIVYFGYEIFCAVNGFYWAEVMGIDVLPNILLID